MSGMLVTRINNLLQSIYNQPSYFSGQSLDSCAAIAGQLMQAMRLDSQLTYTPVQRNIWSENDSVLITYANTIHSTSSTNRITPLSTLNEFLVEHLNEAFSAVHLLPFFPSSSDAGFAVQDYYQVDPQHGSWGDIEAIAENFYVMADLVINHCSSSHQWFINFLQSASPGKDYFHVVEPDTDLSQVVRPRTSPLLFEVETTEGNKHVWCTFGHDQVDVNFANPAVLIEFAKILRHMLDRGIDIFRLDAIAFLWKEPGTSCINHAKTHYMVRLLRMLLEHAHPHSIIITETNIPNRENLEYFGNGNEAHWVYNFSLPPLLLYTMVSGNSQHLKKWLMSMPPARNGTAYFNFIATHDGIGLRPVEGLLSDRELDSLMAVLENYGGKVSYRALEAGDAKPYEVNISLFDAFRGTFFGPDDYACERFLCAHAIMFALEGVPGVYIQSMFGTHNDYKKMEKTGEFRSINRHEWALDELEKTLAADNQHRKIFQSMVDLLAIRKKQPAFHPNATQFTLQLENHFFGLWRQSEDRQQSIFSISNVSAKVQTLNLVNVNLIETDNWIDLIAGQAVTNNNQSIKLQPYQSVWLSNIF